jgi:putative ABC transport system permease protein
VRFLPDGWRRAFRIWRRPSEQEVDAELDFHFDERVEELIARGILPDVARARALEEFGDVATVRAGLVAIDERIATGRSRAGRWEWVAQDLRYVLRSLRRSPGFVGAVGLTLALGLGANAAVFSLLDRLFTRPPAGVQAPAQIRRLYVLNSPQPGMASMADRLTPVLNYAEFRATRGQLPTSIRMAGYDVGNVALAKVPDAPQANASYVLGDYFALLGLRPAAGRFFDADELEPDTPAPLAVISFRVWKSRFGSRQDINGQTIDLDGKHYTIVGVAPGNFSGIDNDAVDFWLPMNMLDAPGPHGLPWYKEEWDYPIHGLVAAPTRQAIATVEQIATTAFRYASQHADSGANAVTFALLARPRMTHGPANAAVAITTRLAGVSLILLLIACANVTNLLLVRGFRRRREIAVRLALGVSRRRLIRMLLLESAVLAGIGAVLAIVVAWWGGGVLRHLLMPSVRWAGGPVDSRIVLFTMALALVAALAAGILPAFQASRPDVAESLKTGGAGSGRSRSRWRSGLVIAQAALSVVLLAGAGLFVRSLRSIDTEGTGYDVDRLIFASVTWDHDAGDHRADVEAGFVNLLDRVRRLPAVQLVAVAAMPPMRGRVFAAIFLPDRDSIPRPRDNIANYVSPEFFAAAGMHVVEGRGILASDAIGAAAIVVVNQTLARTFWPGQEAVGKCIIVGKRTSPCRPVVGVVADVHADQVVEDPSPMYYFPIAQAGAFPFSPGALVIRARPGQTAAAVTAIQNELRRGYGDWSIPHVRSMVDDLAPQLRPWRLGAALFSATGLLALLIAIVGIYSTISYTFSQRTHEIGVRMALGARTGSIARLVVGDGISIVAIGILIGLLLSIAAGRLVASMLYRTSPHDPQVLAVAGLVLLAAAGVACALPAWRALRVDPATALRAE